MSNPISINFQQYDADFATLVRGRLESLAAIPDAEAFKQYNEVIAQLRAMVRDDAAVYRCERHMAAYEAVKYKDAGVDAGGRPHSRRFDDILCFLCHASAILHHPFDLPNQLVSGKYEIIREALQEKIQLITVWLETAKADRAVMATG